VKVAFQGEPGAYSEEAVRALFGPSAQPLPRPTFRAVFEALWTQEAVRAVVPLENSIAGVVAEPCDLLLEQPVQLVGELALPIRHCLLGLEGARIEDLRQVWSHPQALAQCARFLQQRGLEAVAEYDTAGSAKKLAAQRPKATGAIASRLAGELYGLSVLAESIASAAHNATRFVAVAPLSPTAVDGRAELKTSIAFTLEPKPGALHDVLRLLARSGADVTRLISRPRPEAPWQYVFHLDFIGPHPGQALETCTTRLWMLGSY
jgi:prephenate dehydratase